MLTYLDIVNTVIAESKLSLDPLTSSNFDSPPRTRLYDDIKRWVNTSYKELLLRRKELFTRNERAVITVWPRVHLSGLTYIPSVGDVLEDTDSGLEFTVMSVSEAEDVNNSPVVERTVGVEFIEGVAPSELKVGAILNRLLPTPLAAVAEVKGPGYIDFREEVPGLDYIVEDSLAITDTPYRINAVIPPWGWDLTDRLVSPFTAGTPLTLYKTRQGTYGIYPVGDKPLTLTFSYVRALPTLVAWDDVPGDVPPSYIDLIMWKTVAEVADFNNDTKLFSRANKHVELYTTWQERDEMPNVVLDLYRFDGHTGTY